jgi:hypothetical protein
MSNAQSGALAIAALDKRRERLLYRSGGGPPLQ